jgi:hypothetical protein
MLACVSNAYFRSFVKKSFTCCYFFNEIKGFNKIIASKRVVFVKIFNL